ncbi:Diacylglycerol kinase [Modestobacter italicus]|uniref:Diacylglycerol kinase n=1 Tax=Modestobacter italicus (strain DSM 44449 / CECT 9708 / BC 501) TaxID=2732864 RepID=I4EXX6_MODI5|nr:Diacylglycerol kinase [Modestobacter marinus]
MLRGAHRRGVLMAQGREVVVRADTPTVPVGVDGESVHLSAPVRCTVRPGALRVRLPRERPGVRPPAARLDWASLWALALGRPLTSHRDGGEVAGRPPVPPEAGVHPRPRRSPEQGAADGAPRPAGPAGRTPRGHRR